MFFTAALAAAPSAGAKDLRIEGSIDAEEEHTPLVAPIPPNPPALVHIQLEGTGYATHLGHYSLTADETLTMPAKTSVGTFEIETLCGETLFGTVVGAGTQIDPTHVSIVETDTITGGTGCFEGATGTIMVHRLVDQLTLTSSGAIEGSVILAEHRRHGGRH
jgi:hypothetical protein